MPPQEAEQVEERAFAEHVKQERGLVEVVLLDQPLDRRLRAGVGPHEADLVEEQAFGERLDVSRLVDDLRGEEEGRLDVGGMDSRHELSRHVPGRELLLDHPREHRAQRELERLRDAAPQLPGDLGARVPLARLGLLVEPLDSVGPDELALEHAELVAGQREPRLETAQRQPARAG